MDTLKMIICLLAGCCVGLLLLAVGQIKQIEYLESAVVRLEIKYDSQTALIKQLHKITHK